MLYTVHFGSCSDRSCRVALCLWWWWWWSSSSSSSPRPAKCVVVVVVVVVVARRVHGPARRTCHLRRGSDNLRLITFAMAAAAWEIMADAPHAAALVEAFDRLVDEGVIVYGPHQTIRVDANGYPVRTAFLSLVLGPPAKPCAHDS